MSYLPFVDGLRAVAIAAVVMFHACPTALPGGYAGVDVFFVISGFLITRFIAAEMEAGTFSLPRFFVRRARRLLPAAFVCFLSVAALGALILLPDALFYLGRSLLAAIFMYANIFFDSTGGYFAAPSLEKPLLHTWSLAVEDQFYLTWPLLMLLAFRRLPRPAFVALALLLAAASLTLAQVKVGTDQEYAFFQLPARAWELLTGAILALTANRIRMPALAASALSVAGLLSVIASFVILTPDSDFPGLAALPACLGTAAIIAAGLGQQTAVTRLLALRPMVFTGLISYSLYLWHWPLISLFSYYRERPLTAAEATAVVAASIVLAVLSWRFVERPFRIHRTADAGSRLSAGDRRFVLTALAGLLVTGSVAGAIKILKGAPQRYSAETRLLLTQLVSGNPLRQSCDNYDMIFANDAVCNVGRRKGPDESYEVALFGDSMADHWMPLVEDYAREHALAARQVTNGGCALLFGTPVPAFPAAKAQECAAYVREAEKFIAQNPNLRVAVISSYWEKWVWRLEARPGESDSDVEARLSAQAGLETPAFDRVLAETLRVFTSRNIKVLLIGQIPTYPSVPLRCIVSAISARTPTAACGKSRQAAEKELRLSNAAMVRAAAANPAVSVWLPLDGMCQTERCDPVLDQTLLYKNGGHINRFAAQALRRFVVFPDAAARAP